MSFEWPTLLWLLLFAPALAGAHIWSLRRRTKDAVRYSSLAGVRAALGPGQSVRRHLPAGLFVLGLALVLLAVSRPSAVIPLLSSQQTIVLAIDVSMSMRATDVDPSRITAAQAAALAFFEELPPDVRVGIVSFAGTASLVQAPTQSRDELKAAVDRLQLQRHTATGSGLLVSLATLMPEAGIDLESLVFAGAAPRATSAGVERKAQTKPFKQVPPGSYTSGAIVLLSDGRRTMGPNPVEAARMAAERGVKVYTVGFGTKEGGAVDFGGWSMYMRLDEETLKQIAEVTHAEYFHASTAADLKKIYQNLTSRLELEQKRTEIGGLLAGLGALMVLVGVWLSARWFHRAL
jgi:Ca-activated chloride channel family protein